MNERYRTFPGSSSCTHTHTASASHPVGVSGGVVAAAGHPTAAPIINVHPLSTGEIYCRRASDRSTVAFVVLAHAIAIPGEGSKPCNTCSALPSLSAGPAITCASEKPDSFPVHRKFASKVYGTKKKKTAQQKQQQQHLPIVGPFSFPPPPKGGVEVLGADKMRSQNCTTS